MYLYNIYCKSSHIVVWFDRVTQSLGFKITSCYVLKLWTRTLTSFVNLAIFSDFPVMTKYLLDWYLTSTSFKRKQYYFNRVLYSSGSSSTSLFREWPSDQNKTVHNWILIEFCRYGCFVDSISTPTTANQNSIEKPWLISVRKYCNMC